MLKRLWQDDEGVLTFEWIILVTLLVIGVIGGVAGIRDAMIHEAQGSVGAVVSLDQTYFVTPPLEVGVNSLGTNGSCITNSGAYYSSFLDQATYASGRLTIQQLSNANQTNPQNVGLCPVP